MRGDIVIVRCYGNEPRRLKVWDWDEDHVCVCGFDEYDQLLAGTSERGRVGHHRNDVFYNVTEKLWQELVQMYKAHPVIYNRLAVYRPKEESLAR